MPGHTERGLRNAMIFNSAQRVAELVNQYNEQSTADPEWWKSPAGIRKQGTIRRAVKDLILVATTPLSDGFLRFYGADKEVERRRARQAKVIPISAGRRPLTKGK